MSSRRISSAVLVALSTIVGFGSHAPGQTVTPTRFNSSLPFAPEVGNVEGIQRFGEQLKTDPDRGVGYTYRVLPPAGAAPVGSLRGSNTSPQSASVFSLQSTDQFQTLSAKVDNDLAALRAAREKFEDAQEEEDDETIRRSAKDLQAAEDNLAFQELRLFSASLQPRGNFGTPNVNAGFRGQPYGAPLNTTAGLRTPFGALDGQQAAFDPQSASFSPLAIGFNNAAAVGGDFSGNMLDLYHQPLIHIKLRVVEVGRSDRLELGSILDYVENDRTNDTRVVGNNINQNGRRTSAATRFPNPIDVIHIAGTSASQLANLDGAGALINLTTEHINYVTKLLATEYNADIITAPEVVTSNGQNVEFVSGRKLPFPLGLCFVQGNSCNTQEVFYKHVGTYISVTPRIVNWGKHLEGEGAAPLVATEIGNWNRLIEWMLDPNNVIQFVEKANPADTEPILKRADLIRFVGNRRPVPQEVKTKILLELSQYSAAELRTRLQEVDAEAIRNVGQPGSSGQEQVTDKLGDELVPVPAGSDPILTCACARPCDWQPADCTVDLEVAVRLSDSGSTSITAVRGEVAEALSAVGNAETNVRAVANVLQVQSGHGVVMAGLVGEREEARVSKVPVLGDAPVVGYLFRSKGTTRQKTEILIFIEATVLPPSEFAREATARDFVLGGPYVAGDVLDNPLEYGMYRAGFGSYLPPTNPCENIFWERHARNLRKVVTEVDDTFE